MISSITSVIAMVIGTTLAFMMERIPFSSRRVLITVLRPHKGKH